KLEALQSEQGADARAVLEVLENIIQHKVAPEIQNKLFRFQIIRQLGEGGFGVVYEAIDPKLGRSVAIKIPQLDRLLVPRYRKLFLREAESAASLDHQNIVKIYEVVECGPFTFLVSQLISGPSLEHHLKQAKKPTEDEIISWIIQLAQAVQHAHERGIIHRDIKPGNILLEPVTDPAGGVTLIPKLTDFGIARPLHLLEGQEMTATGEVQGTPDYMAPEQAAGRSEDIGIATDIHALGVILYRLLTDELPYKGLNRAETLHKVIQQEITEVRSTHRKVSKDLEAICLKCLAKVPEGRYRSALELEQDLQAYQEGLPTRARKLKWWERCLRTAYRNPGLAASLTVLATVAICFVVVIVRYERGLIRVNNHLRKVVYAHTLDSASDLLRAGRSANALDLLNSLKHPDFREHCDFAWRLLQSQMLSRNPVYFKGHESSVGSLTVDSDNNVIVLCWNNDMHKWNPFTGEGTELLLDNEKHKHWSAEHYLYGSKGYLSTQGRLIYSNHLGKLESISHRFPLLSKYVHENKTKGRVHIQKNLPGINICIDRTGVLSIDLNTRKERLYTTPDWAALADIDHKFCCVDPFNRWLIAKSRYGRESSTQFRYDLWRFVTGDYLGEVHGLPAGNCDICTFSQTPDLLWVGSYGGDVLGIDLQKIEILYHWKGLLYDTHDYDPVLGKSESALGLEQDHWLVARDNGDLVLLDLQKGTERVLHHFASTVMKISSDTKDSVWVWDKNELVQLNAATWELQKRYQFPEELQDKNGESFLTLGQYLPNMHAMALAGRDGRIAIWKLDYNVPEPFIKSNTMGGAWAASFSPDGKQLAIAGEYGQLHIWDALTRKKIRSFLSNLVLITTVAYSPDGKYLLAGGYDKNLRLWNVETGVCEKVFTGHSQQITCAAWSPCGNYVAAGAKKDKSLSDQANSKVLLWDVKTQRIALEGNWHDDGIRSLAFHPDGKRLYSGSEDRTIAEINWHTGQVLRRFLEAGEVWSLGVRGNYLLAANKERSASLRNLESGVVEKVYSDEQTSLRSHVWTSDGRTIVLAGEHGPIRLWQADTALELCTLNTEKSRVLGLAISPDSTQLVATCHDGRVYWWTIPKE
ncbi:MAG TPA: serine/threonine-protein kinase, partial [Gemmatales bacterium]|nr:serine/threonine-protein kinase [Gemmatales bacterium]